MLGTVHRMALMAIERNWSHLSCYAALHDSHYGVLRAVSGPFIVDATCSAID